MTQQVATRFVIAGGGTAGWICAATLARFLPDGTSITLVESDAIGTVGVGEATIPQFHLLHRALGVDEKALMRATNATFKLGIEFDGWLREGHAYIHAFGTVGRGHGLMPFQQLWLRAQQNGIAGPLESYSFNAQAARKGRIPQGPAGRGPELPYAYHLDATAYAGFLRDYAEARGVNRMEGKIVQVDRDGETGDIAALQLDSGKQVDGDFFIDCTGFRALLIEGALEAGFDDWSGYLPCDRALAVQSQNVSDPLPYTRAIARKAGWQWRIPLQHRTGNGLVYSSAHMSDDEAASTLTRNLEGEALTEPRPIRFTTGMRRRHWIGNCLAVGLSAGFMEPLESTSIHLVQSAISRFLTVLPQGRASLETQDWFNSQARFEWERIRDFLVLHYHANQRLGEPFWDAARDMSIPATLTAKLDLWRDTGAIHREHEELFTGVGWFQVLVGQGVDASGYNLLADALPNAELTRLMAQAERAASEPVDPMPTHAQFLKSYLGQRAVQGVEP